MTKPSITLWKHYVTAPTGVGAVYVRRSDGTSDTYYLTTDHLGSSDKLLKAATGTVQVAESFAPFGARRGSDWQGAPSAADLTAIGNSTPDGFTGHEMLDGVGLIHMRGRVYDPAVGRFLSVDPIVRAVDASQSWNGYGYVEGRTLSWTDPSGWSGCAGNANKNCNLKPAGDSIPTIIVTASRLHRMISEFLLTNGGLGRIESVSAALETDRESEVQGEGVEAPQDQCGLRDLLSDVGSAVYELAFENNFGFDIGIVGVIGNSSSGFQIAQMQVGANVLGQVYVSIGAGRLQGNGVVGYAAASASVIRHRGPVADGGSTSSVAEVSSFLGIGDAVTVQRSANSVGVSIPGIADSVTGRFGLRAGPGLGAAAYQGTVHTGTNVFLGRNRPVPSYTGCNGSL